MFFCCAYGAQVPPTSDGGSRRWGICLEAYPPSRGLVLEDCTDENDARKRQESLKREVEARRAERKAAQGNSVSAPQMERELRRVERESSKVARDLAALQAIQRSLDEVDRLGTPSCKEWLVGYHKLQSVATAGRPAIEVFREAIDGIREMIILATLPLSAIRTAALANNGANLPRGYVLTVNRNGAFFLGYWLENQGIFEVGPNAGSPRLSSGRFAGNTAPARRIIILHELAHILKAEGIHDDFDRDDLVRENDRTVIQHCADVITPPKSGGGSRTLPAPKPGKVP